MAAEHSESGIPERLTTALAVLGCAQILGWCLLAGLFVALFDFMGGPASTAETIFAILTFAVAVGLVIASSVYVANVAAHPRPIVQAIAAVVVFGLTFWASLQVLGGIQAELMLASPYVAIGAMIAVLMPSAPPKWVLLRATLPGFLGVLLIATMTAVSVRVDVSYGVWTLVMIVGLVLVLAAVRFVAELQKRLA